MPAAFARPAKARLLSSSTCHVAQRCLASRSAGSAETVFAAESATFFPFGMPTSEASKALFSDVSWRIDRSQAWALIGSPASQLVDAALLGRARADPRGSVRWPFLEGREAGRGDVERAIRKVAFRTRLESKSALSSSGEFSDYTARYGGIRADDEDAVTLQAHLLEHIEREGVNATLTDIQNTAGVLDVQHLLTMPLITLSNGQTRRARIARALLSRPEVLVLEEPFTGLDVAHRASLATLLGDLHRAQAPHIIMTLRPQDELPEWITHVASFAQDGRISYLGERSGWTPPRSSQPVPPRKSETKSIAEQQDGQVLVDLRNLSISGRTPVLRNVSWQIRSGQRWLLKGHNGSGKTTLLSVVLGDHPQSYSLSDSTLLFGRPRSKWATSQLQSYIGHASPEINNAFPRRGGWSTREAIATGFDSVFSLRPVSPMQSTAIDQLAAQLGRSHAWLESPLVEQRAGEQNLALLMRALVKKPPLIVLDEPMAGMDDATVAKVHEYLESKLEAEQALVLVTHYEEEVPASVTRVLELANGKVVRCD